MDCNRWRKLMANLNMAENEAAFLNLTAAYSEKHRAYHNFDHLDAVLSHLDRAAHLTKRPLEMEVALWFHDAIYNPLSTDNELDSAKWAETFLVENEMPGDFVGRVYGLILATRHSNAPNDLDESVIIDIDLAILGADEETYERFENGVRREYRWVPFFLYRKKRKEILDGFLKRKHLYFNKHFHDKYEATARRNLAKAIACL